MGEQYPLEQLKEIKKRRLDEAERVLQQKKQALEQEEKKLKELEASRDKQKSHREEKLRLLRESMDAGDGSHKIEIAKRYLKIVDQELIKKEEAVKKQKAAVQAAEKAVEAARQDMLKKQRDVQKLKEHKTEWEKEVHKEEKRQEGILTDEIGTISHIRKKRDKQ